MSKGTPIRNVRVPDELWTQAQQKADKAGESLSEVIRKALADYVKRATT